MPRGFGRRPIAAAMLALAATRSGAVSPPPPQIAADCERPVYASDRQVCADPALRALDERVRGAWLAILAAGTAPGSSAWFEPQDAWFRRRSRCAFSERHAACLRAAYAERSAVLQGWIPAADVSRGSGTRLRCVGAPWGDQTVILRYGNDGTLRLGDAAGRPLAVAVSEPGRDDWQPFLRFVAQGRGGQLLPLDGPAANCSAG